MSGQGNPDERGVSPVAGPAQPLVSKKLLTAGIGVAVAVAVGFALWRNSNPPEEPIKEKLPTKLAVDVPYTAPTMIIPRQPAATNVSTAAPPVHYEPVPQPLPPPPATPVLHLPGVPSAPPPRPKPDMISFADSPFPALPGGAARPPGAGGTSGTAGAGQDPTNAGGSASRVVYAASDIDGVKAGLLGDQTFLLTPGILPCTMDTAINSTFEGPIQCHLAADVKPHGVTLLGRGSRIHGWYHNQIQSGQERLFVQADWVEDPSGCFIKFDNAPISDTIGQAGIPGSVDQHYLERFGAAMLLTLGQGGESLAQAALSKGGNTYLNFNGGSNGLDTIASAILRKQIDIPPTITVNQGTDIAVFVTKVLDFAPCYDLKLKRR